MFNDQKSILICAIVLLQAAPAAVAGEKFFSNYAHSRVVHIELLDSDKYSYEVNIKAGETRVIIFRAKKVDQVLIKPDDFDAKILSSKDGLNDMKSFIYRENENGAGELRKSPTDPWGLLPSNGLGSVAATFDSKSPKTLKSPKKKPRR